MKDKAKKLLEEQGIFGLVSDQWNKTEFVDKKAQTAKVHVSFTQTPDRVLLYPSLKTIPEKEALYELFKAFGCLLSKSFSDEQEQVWEQRLIVPDQDHIESFQTRLNDLPNNPLPPPLEANQYTEYLYVINLSKNPVERLVHIHLSNALIKNNVSPREAVDVKKWPSTEAFANHRKYFSLLPLTGAYCPQIDCFGRLLASSVFGFDDVYHTAMRPALTALVKNVLS